MTKPAIGVPNEQLQTSLRFWRQGIQLRRIVLLQTFGEPIEGRMLTDELALVGGDRLADIREDSIDRLAIRGCHRDPGLGMLVVRMIRHGPGVERKSRLIIELGHRPEDRLVRGTKLGVVVNGVCNSSPVAAKLLLLLHWIKRLRPK